MRISFTDAVGTFLGLCAPGIWSVPLLVAGTPASVWVSFRRVVAGRGLRAAFSSGIVGVRVRNSREGLCFEFFGLGRGFEVE